MSAPIALVPGRNFATRYAEARQQHPYLPDLMAFTVELNQLNGTGGVPVTVDEPRRGSRAPWIRFYAQRCCVGVRASSRADAFVVEFIEPLNLRGHQRLGRSRVRLAPRAWTYAPLLNGVPAGCQAPDAAIRRLWQEQHDQAGPPTVPRRPARYDAFCDALETVVEGARQIELAQQQARPSLTYYDVRSAGESRRSSAAIHVFLLSRPGQVKRDDMVQVRQVPDLRGRVLDLDGEQLTVQFEDAVHRPRIPAQGELVVSGNDIVQRIQRDAVAALRAGTTRNPMLLPLLADMSFAPYPGPPESVAAMRPIEPLDGDQTDAFRRALSVPDLLLVLGPPGTGKTRTIVEIATAAAGRNERVLVASQTNTAVDNVIERLPAALTAIRVGNESRIAGAVQHKTLASTAADLQQRILSRTEAAAGRLAPWLAEPSPAQGWLRRLDVALGDVQQARATHALTAEAHRAAVAAVEARFGPSVTRSEQARQDAERTYAQISARVQRLTTQLQAAQGRVDGPFGFLHRWRAVRRQRRLDETIPRAAEAQAALARAVQEITTRTAELRHAVEADAAVHGAARKASEAEVAVNHAGGEARTAARSYTSLLAGVVAVPPLPDDLDGLFSFVDWCRGIEPVLRGRARLLRDWRQQLAGPSDQLHPELLRYADVIGATCIGVGVQKNQLSDLEFDLTVIDEAGQIPLASTLVPLVRAPRAVLVGDHHQLPPFVDDDVRQWLAHRDATASGTDPTQLIELLTHSAFERLIRHAPATNQVLLSRQRRMPAVLADFVSAQFYGGRLSTDAKPRPPSAVFRSPLALVDTADLSPKERAERQRPGTETWQVAGIDNLTEARLVLDLVQWYTRHGREWAVIAPYRAQVQLLTTRLGELLGGEAVGDRVGTVDAFQGREYDIVVYSFTRSNPQGRVGFLSELRRLNVAVTRAREQLILVGDMSTLVRANDAGFRHLAGELFRYAQRHGDVVPSRQLRKRLL
ncbi:AAA domain-containing protein [Plantactinospora sp. ZYX-F-223]|uniref:DEAD/DEAH box helicase n=1 Tax=Plantactinospora sp. ZYX-F-223 TaxID=3144103 RepID=UPI0031FC7D81